MQTRIRWNDEELTTLAAEMVRLRVAQPDLDDLGAVRAAQAVLPAHRQRELKQWSDVALRLQPRLDLLFAAGQPVVETATSTGTEGADEALAAEATAVRASPGARDTLAGDLSASMPGAGDLAAEAVQEAQPAEQAPAHDRNPGAARPHAPAQTTATQSLNPLMVEASILVALQSPAVADALVQLFGKAMSEAFARMSERGANEPAEPATPRSSAARVLLAGFAPTLAKSLEESIRPLCDVRVWRPNQGPQLYETLAGICNVAVIPDEMDDEVDSDLRSRSLVVIRHGGSASKLLERLEAVI